MKKYVFLFFSVCVFSSIWPHVVRLSKIASWHELKDFEGALGISQPIKYYHIVTDSLPPADKVITFTAQDLIDIKKNQKSMMPKVPWKDYLSSQSKEFCPLISANKKVSILLKMPDSRDDVHLEVQSKVDKKKAILKSKIIKIRSLVENFNPDLICFMRGAFLELDSLWIPYTVIFFGVGSLVCQMIKDRRDFARKQEEKSWYRYYIFDPVAEDSRYARLNLTGTRYYSYGQTNFIRTKNQQEFLAGKARFEEDRADYYRLKDEAKELRKLLKRWPEWTLSNQRHLNDDDYGERDCIICLRVISVDQGEWSKFNCTQACAGRFHRRCLLQWFDLCNEQSREIQCPHCQS